MTLRTTTQATCLAGLLALGAASGAAASPAGSAGCTRILEDQTVRLVGDIEEARYVEQYSSGGRPSIGPKRYITIPLGSLTIRATTCQSGGRWRVLSPVVLTPDYEGLDGNGEIVSGRSRAWGIRPTRINNPMGSSQGSIDLQPFVANKGSLWGAVRLLTDVPLPVPFVVDVGRYVAGKFVPDDETRLGVIADLRLEFRISSSGRLSVRSGRGYRTFSEYWAGTGTPKRVREWTIEVRQG